MGWRRIARPLLQLGRCEERPVVCCSFASCLNAPSLPARNDRIVTVSNLLFAARGNGDAPEGGKEKKRKKKEKCATRLAGFASFTKNCSDRRNVTRKSGSSLSPKSTYAANSRGFRIFFSFLQNSSIFILCFPKSRTRSFAWKKNQRATMRTHFADCSFFYHAVYASRGRRRAAEKREQRPLILRFARANPERSAPDTDGNYFKTIAVPLAIRSISDRDDR